MQQIVLGGPSGPASSSNRIAPFRWGHFFQIFCPARGASYGRFRLRFWAHRIGNCEAAIPGYVGAGVTSSYARSKARLGITAVPDAVAELVGIEGGVVSGVINLESSGVEASDW